MIYSLLLTTEKQVVIFFMEWTPFLFFPSHTLHILISYMLIWYTEKTTKQALNLRLQVREELDLMGKYKFRLSDMIPNAWFYKLKDMKRNKSKSQSQSQKLNSTQSHYFSSHPLYFSTKLHGFYNSPFNQKEFSSPHFPEPARKSSRRRPGRKTVYKPSPRVVVNSVSASCNCHSSLNSVGTIPDALCSPDSLFSCSPRTEVHEYSPSEAEGANTVSSDSFDDLASWSSSCKCKPRSSNNDIIIDMESELVGRKTDWIREVDQLRPSSRKPMTPDKKASEASKLRSSSKSREMKANQSLYVKVVEDENMIRNAEKPRTSSIARKSCASPIGVKVRGKSPRSRICRRKNQGHARGNVALSSRLKSKNSCLSESFAMIKASQNPEQDFRESMVEMIVENNIRTTEDLEDLLACYLILNLDEYHGLIIKTFEQIWFEMAEFRI